MRFMNFATALFFVLAIVLGATTDLRAQNLIPDPGFANPSMPAWPASTTGTSDWSWASEDIDNSGSSGSGRFENLWSGAGWYTVNVMQCIENIDDSVHYDFGTMALYPSGQATTGVVEAYVQLVMYDDPGCQTNLDSELSAKVVNNQEDTWMLSSSNDVAMAVGTESVRFVLTITKKDTPLPAYYFFDNVYLRDSILFSDGFETGDTSAWGP